MLYNKDIMKFGIVIDDEKCKGCLLCIQECPQKIIKISDKINETGYQIVRFLDEDKCTGCRFCALVCPEMAIKIIAED